MKKKLIIFGCGNQARVVTGLIDKNFQIIGYVITKKISKKYLNKKNIFFLEKKKIENLTNYKSFFGIIAIGDNNLRKKIFDQINKLNLKIKWISIISKKAIVAENVKIGEGTLIMPGCIINNDTIIKNHCLINTGSIIEHDNYFDYFSSCGPRVVTGGNVKIGKYSYIGIGSVIKEKIIIDDNVNIGGNSFVNKNCKKNSLYYGNPVKLIS